MPFLERAYRHVAAGNRCAAIVAVQLAHEYGSVHVQAVGAAGSPAPSSCSSEPESLAHGYLALERGLEALKAHDYAAARDAGGTAERIGREHSDMGLELRGSSGAPSR